MKQILLIITISICLSEFSHGQTLNNYLEIAAKNNPELSAYFHEYQASLEKIPQAGALPDPEISLSMFIGRDGLFMERFMGKQNTEIQAMQMFPWFGMLRTRKDEASKMAVARYELYQETKNRLFYQVKNTWYDLYQLEEEIRITTENLEILKKYERLALIRFQSAGTGSGGAMQNTGSMNQTKPTTSTGSMGGGMSMGGKANVTGSSSPGGMPSANPSMGAAKSGMSDVLRVRMEIKELENQLASLQDSRAPLVAEFNRLLNRNYDEAVTIADTLSDRALSIDRLALLDSISQNNPMVRMLEAENQAYEAQKKMARLEGKPMIGAGLTYMQFSPRYENDMAMGGDDMVMPMVRLTLPIYRKKYNALYKEAELKQKAVQLRKGNTVNLLATEWNSNLRDLDNATRKTTLYREQSGLARQTLELLMVSYSTEGRDFEEVLRVQQQLIDYEFRLIAAIVDQHKSVALFEMLAATELN
ncbi:MAG TPA: TolC family protein [Cyclobacteriaceae bacterium]|nr:TolC family protein [Cyclobacteriaceae bacterium]HRJ80938.1 TolC family protein [Cyclobacteriaceae bacterium]